MSLYELRGMIANCAIENKAHEIALKKVDILIGKFGLFRNVDLNTISLLYNGNKTKSLLK